MAWAAIRDNLALVTVEILDSLVGVVELRDEKIDSVSCFHYRGNIDIEAQVEERIANLDPTLEGYEEIVRSIEQQPQSEQNVEFWVGKEDYLPRQIEVYQDMVFTEDWDEDTENENRIIATYSFIFFDFNEPIQIEPPITD